MKKLTIEIFLFALICSFSVPVTAQLPVSLNLPQVSPKETRSLTIGLTTIAFEYNSVATRDREIWGGLVPYGEVWRTGANANTLFSVTDDVLINGEPLAAGEYAIHTIPNEDSWTIIFSNFTTAWGSYFYDESEDALRIEVVPEKMTSTYEWMKFSFENYTDTSADISLKWAGLKVPFKLEVPMEVTFRNIENQFRTLPAFSWHGWYQGAEYTLRKDYNLDKGLEWAEQAVRRERNPQTVGLLGRLQVVNEMKEEALKSASELTKDWKGNWRAHFSAGEIYKEAGENKKAIKAYEKARDLTENERTKNLLQGRIDSLK